MSQCLYDITTILGKQFTHYAIGIVFLINPTYVERFTSIKLHVSGSISLPLGFFSTFPSGTLNYHHKIVLSLGLCQNIAYFRTNDVNTTVLGWPLWVHQAYFLSLLTTRRVGRSLTLPTT